jgi:hypothetical protein
MVSTLGVVAFILLVYMAVLATMIDEKHTILFIGRKLTI